MQCFTLVPSFVSLLTADLYDSCITLVPFYPICFPDDVIVDDVGGQEVSNVSLLCPLLYHSCITLPSSYLPAGHLYSQPTIGHFHSDWDKIFVVEILQNAINDITQTFTRILIKETKHILQVSVPNYQIHYDIIKKNPSNPYNRKKKPFSLTLQVCVQNDISEARRQLWEDSWVGPSLSQSVVQPSPVPTQFKDKRQKQFKDKRQTRDKKNTDMATTNQVHQVYMRHNYMKK